MAMILTCQSCGDQIGTLKPGMAAREYYKYIDLERAVICPGRGKHPLPKRNDEAFWLDSRSYTFLSRNRHVLIVGRVRRP